MKIFRYALLVLNYIALVGELYFFLPYLSKIEFFESGFFLMILAALILISLHVLLLIGNITYLHLSKKYLAKEN